MTYEDTMRTLRVTPNVLTSIRFAIAPVIFLIFVWEFVANKSYFFEVSGPGEYFNFTLWCLALALAGALTDAIDGFLARHFSQYGWESKLGRHLDPLADKAFGFALVAAIPLHLEAGLYLIPYILSTAYTAWYSKETTRLRMAGLIEMANRGAKWKTAMLSVSQILFMVYIAFEHMEWAAIFESMIFFIALSLMIIAAVFARFALRDYYAQAAAVSRLQQNTTRPT